MDQTTSSTELSITIDEPPWLSLDRVSIRQEIGAAGRQEGLKSFEHWNRLKNPLDLAVFPDGSLDQEGRAGAGYCVYRGSQEIMFGRVPLGRNVEVYDVEIIGTISGLQAACSHWMARFAKNVRVCLDNEEAAIQLHTGSATPSSSTRILEFQSLRRSWLEREKALATDEGSVLIRWIPGHQGIFGNERVDTLAKIACSLESQNTEASVARGRRILEERYNNSLASYWNTHSPKRYKDLGINICTRAPPEVNSLPIYSLGKLLVARSGHGDVASYHHRLHHIDADLHCSCGLEKLPDHLFSCRLIRRIRGRILGSIQGTAENIKWALGTSSGAQVFHKFQMALGGLNGL